MGAVTLRHKYGVISRLERAFSRAHLYVCACMCLDIGMSESVVCISYHWSLERNSSKTVSYYLQNAPVHLSPVYIVYRVFCKVSSHCTPIIIHCN